MPGEPVLMIALHLTRIENGMTAMRNDLTSIRDEMHAGFAQVRDEMRAGFDRVDRRVGNVETRVEGLAKLEQHRARKRRK
jgi:hypothetical protein